MSKPILSYSVLVLLVTSVLLIIFNVNFKNTLYSSISHIDIISNSFTKPTIITSEQSSHSVSLTSLPNNQRRSLQVSSFLDLFKATKNSTNNNNPSTHADSIKPSVIVKCANQTRCIQPVLQLIKTYKVYFCKHLGYGVRFYYLVREGLLLHPNIILVADPKDADYIVYLPVSSEWYVLLNYHTHYIIHTICCILDDTNINLNIHYTSHVIGIKLSAEIQLIVVKQ